ncbi:MAG TPA: WD40 repeat domain-containing protein, partial [Gemmata sp.]|nr:WD40 repeat domain-containing protein [Gemmata sp.]
SAQDKSKAASEVVTSETLEKLLKSSLLKPEKLAQGRYQITSSKKIEDLTWTIPCVVSLNSDGTRIILSSRWSTIPGPATIPQEVSFKILLANIKILPASIGIENGALCMKRPVENRDVSPEAFRQVFDDFIDSITSNVSLLSGTEWTIPNQLLRMGFGGSPVRSLAVFPSGNRIVVGKASPADPVRIFELEVGKTATDLVKTPGGTWALAVSPDSKNVFVGSTDGVLQNVEVDSKKIVKSYEGHKHYVWSFALSSDGKQLFSSGGAFKKDGKPVDKDNKPTDSPDWSIRMWDVESGKEIKKFDGHAAFIHSVTLSPSGKLLASASDDQTLRVWDVKSGKELKQLPVPQFGLNSAVFRSESQIVAGDRGNSIRIYDIESGKELKSLLGHTGAVYRVVVSPDGKRALSCGPDGSVRLWDIETGSPLAVFGGHLDAVGNIAFSPDGQTAISGSYDGSARQWQLPR